MFRETDFVVTEPINVLPRYKKMPTQLQKHNMIIIIINFTLITVRYIIGFEFCASLITGSNYTRHAGVLGTD